MDTTDQDGDPVEVAADETLRPGTDLAGLAQLRAAFEDAALAERFPEIDWRITPGGSSPLTDGASAVLIASAERADQLGLRPRGRFHGFAVVGDDPLQMLTGPIPATRRVLERTGLSIGDVDAFEVNEAFAPAPLAWQQEVGTDPNVSTSAAARSPRSPVGTWGTKLLATLVNLLEDHGWC